ncbi:FAD-dependent oxidoreductase [Labrys miyagiensis]|uniref:Pyridine nucleotide-disulfide oxidoreductase domain-containing protein 2 n=1 Tax=Labrys miyagiensis TaxID=346912 RepID=A0ABQ6CML3_9HYPH|nr:NAD(P)/FAD-dependent oxidoreductase [Labrys miyagiensis]GLS21384.1 FAD-dependent oxidoreductase [Labrys miyagiensis]
MAGALSQQGAAAQVAYDAVIIGGGHNGLTCAYYLARAGRKVKVLERRSVVGGAAVTEEFHPGFRNSVASYTVSLLNPKIIHDMELARHGLRIVERQASNFFPFPDGRYILSGEGRTQAEIARFSTRDAERFPAYSAEIDTIADVLRDLILQTPPNVSDDGWLSSLPELLRAGKLGHRLAKLDMHHRRVLLDLFTKSASDYLGDWFESEEVKALFGFDSIIGAYLAPSTPGSAYVLLHHVFGEVNGKKGAWGHAIGGMGAITQAMAAAAREAGAEIETDAAVKEIIVEKRATAGVLLEDGRIVRAKAVAANIGPRLLFNKIVPEDAVPADFLRRIRRFKVGSGVLRMNVALSELPSFTALPGHEQGIHHTAGIVIAPSLAYMEDAFLDARRTGWSKAPIVEMLIPSTLDDTLAPQGRHVASLFCQYVAPQLPGGQSWDERREEVADLMIETVDRYAPGFRQSVLGRQVLTPLDLERIFGLVGGDIFHGALSLDQLFSARPMLGYGDYRTPLKGLYICGSGTHPGGGVTGAPGHNAAREMLCDRV